MITASQVSPHCEVNTSQELQSVSTYVTEMWRSGRHVTRFYHDDDKSFERDEASLGQNVASGKESK